MPTRQEYQIIRDLIKFVNITNDLVDNASYIMREINPNTGEPLTKTDDDGITVRPYTLAEIKESLVGIRDGIRGYWSIVNRFINQYGLQNLNTMLQSQGIDGAVIKNDLEHIKTIIEEASVQVAAAQDKTDLLNISDYIDTNVPKLPLIRRSW